MSDDANCSVRARTVTLPEKGIDEKGVLGYNYSR